MICTGSREIHQEKPYSLISTYHEKLAPNQFSARFCNPPNIISAIFVPISGKFELPDAQCTRSHMQQIRNNFIKDNVI